MMYSISRLRCLFTHQATVCFPPSISVLGSWIEGTRQHHQFYQIHLLKMPTPTVTMPVGSLSATILPAVCVNGETKNGRDTLPAMIRIHDALSEDALGNLTDISNSPGHKTTKEKSLSSAFAAIQASRPGSRLKRGSVLKTFPSFTKEDTKTKDQDSTESGTPELIATPKLKAQDKKASPANASKLRRQQFRNSLRNPFRNKSDGPSEKTTDSTSSDDKISDILLPPPTIEPDTPKLARFSFEGFLYSDRKDNTTAKGKQHEKRSSIPMTTQGKGPSSRSLNAGLGAMDTDEDKLSGHYRTPSSSYPTEGVRTPPVHPKSPPGTIRGRLLSTISRYSLTNSRLSALRSSSSSPSSTRATWDENDLATPSEVPDASVENPYDDPEFDGGREIAEVMKLTNPDSPSNPTVADLEETEKVADTMTSPATDSKGNGQETEWQVPDSWQVPPEMPMSQEDYRQSARSARTTDDNGMAVNQVEQPTLTKKYWEELDKLEMELGNTVEPKSDDKGKGADKTNNPKLMVPEQPLQGKCGTDEQPFKRYTPKDLRVPAIRAEVMANPIAHTYLLNKRWLLRDGIAGQKTDDKGQGVDETSKESFQRYTLTDIRRPEVQADVMANPAKHLYLADELKQLQKGVGTTTDYMELIEFWDILRRILRCGKAGEKTGTSTETTATSPFASGGTDPLKRNTRIEEPVAGPSTTTKNQDPTTLVPHYPDGSKVVHTRGGSDFLLTLDGFSGPLKDTEPAQPNAITIRDSLTRRTQLSSEGAASASSLRVFHSNKIRSKSISTTSLAPSRTPKMVAKASKRRLSNESLGSRIRQRVGHSRFNCWLVKRLRLRGSADKWDTSTEQAARNARRREKRNRQKRIRLSKEKRAKTVKDNGKVVDLNGKKAEPDKMVADQQKGSIAKRTGSWIRKKKSDLALSGFLTGELWEEIKVKKENK